MRTAVTKRGQTVIPSEIRDRYNIKGGDTIEWIDDGERLRAIPITSDPITALRGCARGEKLTKRLLEEREKDRDNE